MLYGGASEKLKCGPDPAATVMIRPEPSVVYAAAGLMVLLVIVNTIAAGPSRCGWTAG